jgi:hypothetical protein
VWDSKLARGVDRRYSVVSFCLHGSSTNHREFCRLKLFKRTESEGDGDSDVYTATWVFTVDVKNVGIGGCVAGGDETPPAV